MHSPAEPDESQAAAARKPGLSVSVVVPTRRRETRLAFLLDALATQTTPHERFEVIVVRSEDPGPKTDAPPGLPVRFLEAPADSSAAQKRNIGWRAAGAPLVAFTDDDCRPRPDWLERLGVAADGQAEPFFVQGRTEPDPAETRLLYGLARSQAVLGPSDWYETCNMAYPRALLERLGGFDEDFVGAGEDTDLGLRAVTAGARHVYADDARVLHAVHSRHLRQAVRDQGRWHDVPLLLARHPQQQRALELGIFWRRAHSRLLLALVGALLVKRRRPGLGLLAAAPYALYRTRPYERSPRGVARAALDLPAHAVVDAAGVVATVRAGLRHRVPII